MTKKSGVAAAQEQDNAQPVLRVIGAISRPHINAYLPNAVTQGLMISEMPRLHADDAQVNGDPASAAVQCRAARLSFFAFNATLDIGHPESETRCAETP